MGVMIYSHPEDDTPFSYKHTGLGSNEFKLTRCLEYLGGAEPAEFLVILEAHVSDCPYECLIAGIANVACKKALKFEAVIFQDFARKYGP